ncbi:MAG: polysulfide reductase NrfD [Deltaproteobacteria bacterium]|nr:polysulfide reductase NrfD [Deltaproteobacteria bacterium]
MLELALRGNRRYWNWIAFLVIVIGVGAGVFSRQLEFGLGITGLSRDVSWGFYVAQLTFLVGVAASAVMLVLPYYLHDYKAFAKITILGEFVAVSAICMCLLFLFVDLGQPARALNIFLYPTPNSIIFWDGIVLIGYLTLNLIVGWNVLEAERNAVRPPAWAKPLIYLSIPWAFAIHTVTAFLYCGLPGRGFWLTAILAPRFLASAFASGPALLILLCLLLKKATGFDAGKKAIESLAVIVMYGMLANLFFLACEVFVAFYSGIPEHTSHFIYLYQGLDGKQGLVFWMRMSLVLMGTSGVLLVIPSVKRNHVLLGIACLMLFFGTWIDKGLGLVSGGFIPSPLHRITEYAPTLPELMISTGVYAIGLLCLTILLKMAVNVKKEAGEQVAVSGGFSRSHGH